MRTKLSRRTVLRGAGSAALALPLLEAMTTAAQAAPKRYVVFFFGNGVHDLKYWTPAERGAAWTPTRYLEPLAPLKGELTIVSGLKSTARYVTIAGPDEHSHCNGTLLTCVPITAQGAGGVSVDQVVARQVAGGTRFASLQVLAAGPYQESPGGPHTRNLAWAGLNQPLPPVSDPVQLFRQLFGAAPGGVPGDAAMTARDRVRRSVLDFVRDDTLGLQRELGAADRARLDAHLTALRELERQIGLATAGTSEGPRPAACTAGAAPATGQPVVEHVRAMLRLATTALACDLTRVLTFQLGTAGGTMLLNLIGVGGNDHGLSHAKGPAADEQGILVTQWKLKMFAELVTQLRDARDGAGTLLDSSFVLCTSECGTGRGHVCENMNIILAGRAGGLRPAGHVVLPTGTPLARLHLTTLQLLGVPAARFGMDGTQPISFG